MRGLSGEYKGLHISTAFESPFLHEQIVLTGQTTLRKNSSAIAGDNINRIIEMATGRDKYAKDTQTEIDDLCNKIENGKTELAAPFPQQDEFERLSLRSAELSHLLNEDVDSDEKEKSNLNFEKQRRLNAIFNGESDSLCAKYFFSFVKKEIQSPDDDWSDICDKKAITFLLDEGFSKDNVSNTIIKFSPTVPSKEDVHNMLEECTSRAASSR